jgi:AcrR family transcriptional regulator
MAKTRTAPRKAPRQSRSQATVDALVEAGARALALEGYERANVNRIAELAGVSVGSLYQYFPSKEALVTAVSRRHSARMIEVFQKDILSLAFVPLHEAVRGVVLRVFEAYAVDPALRRVLVHEVPHLGALTRSLEFDELVHEWLLAYFAHNAARIRPRNVDLAVQILRAAVEAVAAAIVVRGDPQLLRSSEVVDEVCVLVLRYVEK